jgi:cytochrome c-type biogenesis protein CcmH
VSRTVAAALLLMLALALPAQAVGQAKTSLPDIEDEVMCVSCKVPLNIAESPQADRQRETIKQYVEQGLTKDEVKDRLVADYGSNVLAMPENDGFGLAAYVVPIAVVLVLVALLAMLIPRWRRRPPRPIAAGDAPAASSEELKRLDEELGRVG